MDGLEVAMNGLVIRIIMYEVSWGTVDYYSKLKLTKFLYILMNCIKMLCCIRGWVDIVVVLRGCV